MIVSEEMVLRRWGGRVRLGVEFEVEELGRRGGVFVFEYLYSSSNRE